MSTERQDHPNPYPPAVSRAEQALEAANRMVSLLFPLLLALLAIVAVVLVLALESYRTPAGMTFTGGLITSVGAWLLRQRATSSSPSDAAGS